MRPLDAVHEMRTVRVLSCLLSDVPRLSSIFVFQAEDGIRDLVRSRGLGDVYKRQPPLSPPAPDLRSSGCRRARPGRPRKSSRPTGTAPVSYTHLTLPTSDLV